MSSLVFCSFEVGGLPYRIAEILNKHRVETYYVSLAEPRKDHDSTRFHSGLHAQSWDLTYLFRGCSLWSNHAVNILKRIKERFHIRSCFATGSRAYLLEKAGISYKYWSFGSDLDQLCFSPVLPPDYPLWIKGLHYPYFILTTRREQRKSLHYAASLMIAPYQYDASRSLFSEKRLFFLPHFLNIINYQALAEKKKESRSIICNHISASHYFFSSTRHVWAGHLRNQSDNKGNDVILHAFKKYIDITGDHRVKLVLIEKGPDVEASKALADHLNIRQYVVWTKEMQRDDLNRYYQGATLCFGQFGTAVITFSALEPLANASACISFFGLSDTRVPFYKELPPLVNSKDPEQIAIEMQRLQMDGTANDAVMEESWRWTKSNCSERVFVDAFVREFAESTL